MMRFNICKIAEVYTFPDEHFAENNDELSTEELSHASIKKDICFPVVKNESGVVTDSTGNLESHSSFRSNNVPSSSVKTESFFPIFDVGNKVNLGITEESVSISNNYAMRLASPSGTGTQIPPITEQKQCPISNNITNSKQLNPSLPIKSEVISVSEDVLNQSKNICASNKLTLSTSNKLTSNKLTQSLTAEAIIHSTNKNQTLSSRQVLPSSVKLKKSDKSCVSVNTNDTTDIPPSITIFSANETCNTIKITEARTPKDSVEEMTNLLTNQKLMTVDIQDVIAAGLIRPILIKKEPTAPASQHNTTAKRNKVGNTPNAEKTTIQSALPLEREMMVVNANVISSQMVSQVSIKKEKSCDQVNCRKNTVKGNDDTPSNLAISSVISNNSSLIPEPRNVSLDATKAQTSLNGWKQITADEMPVIPFEKIVLPFTLKKESIVHDLQNNSTEKLNDHVECTPTAGEWPLQNKETSANTKGLSSDIVLKQTIKIENSSELLSSVTLNKHDIFPSSSTLSSMKKSSCNGVLPPVPQSIPMEFNKDNIPCSSTSNSVAIVKTEAKELNSIVDNKSIVMEDSVPASRNTSPFEMKRESQDFRTKVRKSWKISNKPAMRNNVVCNGNASKPVIDANQSNFSNTMEEISDVILTTFSSTETEINNSSESSNLNRTFACDLCPRAFTRQSTLTVHRRTHDGESLDCSICEKSFRTKLTLRRHMEIHTDDKKFQCGICSKSFLRKSSLFEHERVHSGVKPYQCEVCHRFFRTKCMLNEHTRVHSDERPYYCAICSKGFKAKKTLLEHERFHTGEGLLSCDKCDKVFNNKSNFNEHMRVYHTRQRDYECKVCFKRFMRKSDLKMHDRIHLSVREYKCELCMKTFLTSAVLNRHNLMHTGETPFKCDICNKCLASRVDLERHVMVHTGEKPFKCNSCSKAFARQDALSKHERIHAGIKLFKCQICSKSFSTNNQMVAHMRYHTGERPFECDVCRKSFRIRSSLSAHMKIHMTEKMFFCELCHKSFFSMTDVKRHRKVAHSEKKFVCEHCDKAFSLRKDLARHNTVHTGEKPYKCNICSKAFTRNYALTAHKKIHNQDKSEEELE